MTIYLSKFVFLHQGMHCFIFNSKLSQSFLRRLLKQETHVAYRSPKKQFQSITTSAKSYDYTIMLIKRVNTLSPFWELNTSYLYKLEYPSPKNALYQVWLLLAQWFRRKRFWILLMHFCYFVIISPWKKARSFIWIPFIQKCLVPSLVEINPRILEKNIFKLHQCIFALGKGHGPSFEHNWIPFTQGCFVQS